MTPHGYSRYSNEKCRCEVCRAAWTAYNVALREVRRHRLARDPSIVPHGSSNTYRNWGCRCRDCTDAHTIKCREMQQRRRLRT